MSEINEDKDKQSENDENLDENIKNSLKNEAKETTDQAEAASAEKEDEEKAKLTISDIEEELKTIKEEKLRLLAEMENLRKRFDKEKIDLIKFGNSNIIKDFLSPIDNISRALKSVSEKEFNEKNYKELINGIEMVNEEIKKILENNGVKKIEALNKKFDHNFHQAMMEIDSDKESGIVLSELQEGYTINDRLLRPSLVGVSKKTKKNEGNKEKN
tara:strand:+ start:516 stop:1160 length:645 start_codon:yes stop_codon:yes gene_type:complete